LLRNLVAEVREFARLRRSSSVDAVRGHGLDSVVVGRAWLDGTLSLEQTEA
jgi:hypothetical protein